MEVSEFSWCSAKFVYFELASFLWGDFTSCGGGTRFSANFTNTRTSHVQFARWGDFHFFKFDHFIVLMLILVVSFPANFTNMGTSQGGSLNCNFAILSTAMFIVILVHLPLTALFFLRLYFWCFFQLISLIDGAGSSFGELPEICGKKNSENYKFPTFLKA